MYRTQEGCAIRRAGEVEMDTPIKAKPAADLRDYLAEERTFLAWIRTSIALMAIRLCGGAFRDFRERAPHDEPRVRHSAPRALPLVWNGAYRDRRNRKSLFCTALYAPGW